jgi:hypothetical protein
VIHQIKAAAATNIIPRRTRDAQLLMTAFLSPLPSLAAHRLGSVRLSRLRLSTGLGGSVSPLAGTPVSPLAGAENGCLALSVGLPLSSCVARIESRSVTGVPAIRQAEYSSARQPARQPGRRQAVRRKNNMLGSCLGFADGLEIWLATGCATEAMTRRKFGRRNRSENACHRVTFRLSEAFPENIRPLA